MSRTIAPPTTLTTARAERLANARPPVRRTGTRSAVIAAALADYAATTR